jgi:hypothetical protein
MKAEHQTSFLETDEQSRPRSRRGVQSLDMVQERLNCLHEIGGLSWRRIAALEEYEGIPPGTLNAIAKGREPKKLEHRKILGLPEIIEIEVKRNHLGRFS